MCNLELDFFFCLILFLVVCMFMIDENVCELFYDSFGNDLLSNVFIIEVKE